MRKKVLVWAYFSKNVGDDLFLKVLFDRYPNVEWGLLTANRNYNYVFRNYKNVKIIYTYRNIRIGKQVVNPFFKLNDLLLSFNNYDALIFIGGSIFKQNSAWEKRLNERKYLLDKFKKIGKKVFIVGANFGPFDNPRFIKGYRDIFPYFDDICFRDIYSYNLFKDLENVRVASDVIFNLKINPTSKQEKTVGFSIIDIENRDGLSDYYENYKNKIIELVKNYIKLGYNIKLFSLCENEGDLKACNEIAQKVSFKEDKLAIVNYDGDLNKFLNEYNTCEDIIGTRFHSIILAILFKQNFYPIIYSEKTVNTLRDLNLENPNCYIENINSLKLDDVIGNTNKNKIKNESYIKNAQQQFSKLDLFIGGK